MAGLVRQQERSVARERMLARAGAALVAATEPRRRSTERRSTAVASSLGRRRRGALCLVEDGELHVVAADGTLEPRGGAWPLGAATAAELLAAPTGGRARRARCARTCASGCRARRTPASCGLAARAASARGLLVVAGATATRRSQRAAERAARAGHPGLARARERGAHRGGPPARERGALRLARPARQRPHHRARRRRHGRLPEPLDRARPRLHRRRRSSARRFDRPARARRGEPPAAPAGRRRRRTPARDRGRSSARCATATARCASSRSCTPNLLDDEHVARHRPQQPRRQRAQGLRGAARPPGLPRPGHEPGQPRAVRRARAPRGRARAPRATAASPSSSSTSTTSRRSTTASATPPATRCCSRSPSAWTRASAPATPPRASAATSSRSCSRTSTARRRRPTPPSGSSRRSPSRCALDQQGARRPRQHRHLASPSGERRADADELIRNADAAMYIAKRDGKGGYRLFEPAMHEGVLARLELRADLQRAIDDRPVRAALPAGRAPRRRRRSRASRRCCAGATPSAGWCGPDEFIPLAEETGLIVPIGRWVLREGCRQAARDRRQLLPREPPLTMSINLSVKQLQHSRHRGRRPRRARASPASTRAPHARDHRDGDDDRHRPRGAAPGGAQGARRAPGDGRLRHRLLVAELPQPLPGRHPQDGPLVPARRARRRRRPASRPRSSRSARR